MSFAKNEHKLSDKVKIDLKITDEEIAETAKCNVTESTYAVTSSKKNDISQDEDTPLCVNQKSFISIHSTDQLCQLPDIENPTNIQECNVEVLSLNEVFPSTSEDSLSNDDDAPTSRKSKNSNNKPQEENIKSTYVPTNSKSSTVSGSSKEQVDPQATGYSDFDIPKSTLYVIGSNPGEPKMVYTDPPKKISKTMKKYLRNMDKQKGEHNKKSEKDKLNRHGILKDSRCAPECTGDTIQGNQEYATSDDIILPFPMDYWPHLNYTKQCVDKKVKFNTQVVIIHFTGDLCVGQSVETLSKERDQQVRNSELRKTFLTKYNELWSTQK